MDPHRLMEEYAEQCSWTAATQLELCLRYIERQRDSATFADFLAQIKRFEGMSPADFGKLLAATSIDIEGGSDSG